MTSRLSLEGKHAAISRLSGILEKYVCYVHPNPLRHEDYYWFGISVKDQEAMDHIMQSRFRRQGYRTTIEGERSMEIIVTSLIGKRPYLGKTTVHLHSTEDDFKYPSITLKEEEITDRKRLNTLLTFIVKVKKMRHELRHADRYANQLLFGVGCEHYGVNTPGQMHAVWPEFASFCARSDYRNRIASARQKSRLPDGMTREWVREFRTQPYMREINDALMTCTVLGDEAFGHIDVYSYPI